MILRGIIPVLFACCVSSSAAQEVVPSPSASPSTRAHAQDFSETVIPISALKIGIGEKPRIGYKPSLNPLSYIDVEESLIGKFGTGFCLDRACRFIGTNYHVAVASHPRKIKGEKVVQQYLATGPDDEGATINEGLSLVKYNVSRDLAIFELRHPLPHHHGVAFNLEGLDDGQEVEIYAYPKETLNPIRRRGLQQFRAKFKGETTTGLLAFDYSLSDKTIRPGASGGVVVDSKTRQIVGILSGTARNAERIALAVPVQSLADFVRKVQPWLAQSIFPPSKGSIPPASVDLHPKFIEPSADSLQHRPAEPTEVKVLREKAQLLVDNMRNFIAVQTFAWGSGNKEPAAEAAFEVQVLDGYQRFREYPDGKKELQDSPLPSLNTVVGTGGEWSELPQMVGKVPRFKIHQFPDAVVNGRRIKVFQYHAEIEDGVCVFKSITDFIFFTTSKYLTAPCYGEVWTDEDSNILRISEHYEGLLDSWKDLQGVVTYGWLRLPDESTRLVPLTIATQAEHKKKVYWCRGAFTDYRVFDSRVKVITNGYVQSLPP